MRKAWIASVVTLVVVAACMPVRASGRAPRGEGYPLAPALAFDARGSDPWLDRQTGGQNRMTITLERSPLLDQALHPSVHPVLTGAEAAAQVDLVSGATLARRAEVARHSALDIVERVAAAASREHHDLARVIRQAGGRAIGHDVLTGSVTAVLPHSAVRTVAALPSVAAVEQAPMERPLGLETSTAAVGAPAFWNAGYAGGTGSADASPVDLAILHDKIEEGHPAFAGIQFQRPSDSPVGTSCGQYVSGCEHGTEVASMAISRGAAGCGICSGADAARRGVVPGADSILDAQASGMTDDTAWALGVASFGVPGADDPAEVISDSHGSPSTGDDSLSLQSVDKLVSAYGALMAYPAGNEGPARSVNEDCIAYDTLCMGGFTPRGTVDPADDVVDDFSSRGPTPGGRKKPDLVAVSTSEFANQHWIRDGRLWSGGSGTSLAAPQGAAAAALLAGSGISAPIAQKAILINSARQGRATPSSPMGTQSGWQPDWGWGAVDLEAALQERTNFYFDDVPGGAVHFYRASTQAPGDRATLVWNRRALGCIEPGCSTTALTLTNLDLEQLDPATGAIEARSASGIDNVEQVRSPGTGPVIYKVKAASTVDGLPGEPYALAARRQVTPLQQPRPRVSVTLSTTAARPGDDVQVIAEVTNPSADLSAEDARAAVRLPAGVELAPGSAPASSDIGSLAPGEKKTLAWTVRAGGDAVASIAVEAMASRYGETFSAQDSATFTSDGTPPSVSIGAPAGETTDTALAVSWLGNDAGVGLRDYTVEVSSNDGPFAPWLTATSATAATYSATTGARYRFRVRATDRLGTTSDFVTSDAVAVIAPRGDPPVATPPPATPPPRSSAALRIRSIARRGGRVEVRGTLATDVFRPLAVELRGKSGGRRVNQRSTASPRAGRFKVTLRVPRRLSGTLTVRYGGDDRFAAGSARIRLRGF